MPETLLLNDSYRVGLALSGGGVRGFAHIGVLKALTQFGVRPAVIAGTSVGSIVGAAYAAGKTWDQIAKMARSVFWPNLLRGHHLEQFCRRHLPATFSQLELPFAAIATEMPARRMVVIRDGNLATAISASCALRSFRRPVLRGGMRLADGGISCVLPSLVCRELGANFVIGSDVWAFGSLLRSFGFSPTSGSGARFYPQHYREALEATDWLIRPLIPVTGYIPSSLTWESVISAGEKAARLSLAQGSDHLPTVAVL